VENNSAINLHGLLIFCPKNLREAVIEGSLLNDQPETKEIFYYFLYETL